MLPNYFSTHPTYQSPFAKTKGFTLIELLVVIAIIAVLSIIGFAIFTGLTSRGNNARRTSDIKAVSDAYEVKRAAANASDYGGLALALTDFSGGAIPTDPVAARQYCIRANAAAAVPNAVVPGDITAAGVCVAPWSAVGTTALSAGAVYFKVCVLLQDNATVRCSSSKQ